jgi:hypothetical protein
MRHIDINEAQQIGGANLPDPSPNPNPSPYPYPIIGSLPFPYPLPGYPIPELWEPTMPGEWPSP